MFFQAEDGIRDRSPSRGIRDVYKRQPSTFAKEEEKETSANVIAEIHVINSFVNLFIIFPLFN